MPVSIASLHKPSAHMLQFMCYADYPLKGCLHCILRFGCSLSRHSIIVLSAACGHVGGKLSNWEGGIRSNAFVSGGFLPEHMRGSKQKGLIAGWDWYATYCNLAGVDPTDHRAKLANLPPIDSYDLWPLLSGQVKTSPRTELAIGDVNQVGGLIQSGYKLLLGNIAQAGWTGPQFPNTTSHWDPNESKETCGNSTATGCLYDIYNDPGEHHNLASLHTDVWHSMMQRLLEINQTFFAPNRGSKDPVACNMATGVYGGFWGPFVDTGNLSKEIVAA